MAKKKQKDKLNKDELEAQKAGVAERVIPDLDTDNFSPTEQKKIVKMVTDDAATGYVVQREWLEHKRRDLLHLNSERPSIIENLNKETWMSDRNLGLAAGISDIYQATLLATCWNPDSIHFKATENNDVDNRDNLEKFAKWMVGPQETDAFPEVDDFINNRVNLGFSMFKIYWKVWYEWIDKRIPKRSKDSKRISGYNTVTEKRRFERGVIKNIDQIDDILLPNYGKKIQDLKWMVEVMHITMQDLEELSDRGVIMNYKDNEVSMKKAYATATAEQEGKLKKEDARFIGTKDAGEPTEEAAKKNAPINVYEWYGWYRKAGKYEKYRFWVEPHSMTFLSGKPLRKINRTGKYPYVGGPLRRRPGFLRGGSLITLIAPALNTLNNIFNQISDFQFFQNCPFGYYDKNQESISSTLQDISPGKLTPIDGNPNDMVMFPNLSRSLAWGYQMIQYVMEVIERLTGAASYFLSTETKGATATRDSIVEEKGQVKFGLWVKRIQIDISEAINMLISLYQDWAPPGLGKRVLGEEDGKEIIKNLSVDDLRGHYDSYIVPDITTGSKAYERQVHMWGFHELQTNSPWFHPTVNPRGNWLLTKEAMKKQGYSNPDHYLPPQPKEQADYSKEAQDHFDQIKQGDTPEPPEANNPQIVDCLATFMRLKDEKIHEIPEEYKANFENYMLQAFMNYGKFMKNVAQDQAVMRTTAAAVGNLEAGGMNRGGQQPNMLPQNNIDPGPQPPLDNGVGGSDSA